MLDAAGEGIEFTEASEFARSIQLREPEDSAKPSDAPSYMEQDGSASAAPQPTPAAVPRQRKSKKSVSAPFKQRSSSR